MSFQVPLTTANQLKPFGQAALLDTAILWWLYIWFQNYSANMKLNLMVVQSNMTPSDFFSGESRRHPRQALILRMVLNF